MQTIKQTAKFRDWFARVPEPAKGRVLTRIKRIELGDFLDCKSVGGAVFETRIHHGPGYRVYFLRKGDAIVYLLAGGTKGSQTADIDAAKQLAKEI